MNDWIVKIMGLPQDASAHGAAIDNMLALIHLFMIALAVGWSIFFIVALVRFRKGHHPKADADKAHNRISNFIELGVVLIEGILLFGFAFPLWAQRVAAFPPESESVVVRVIGEQFAWNIHYPGTDGVFGLRDPKWVSPDNPAGLDRTSPNAQDDILTINQLHLPQGKPAIIHITSKDVIHGFSLRQMRVSQDAIPGQNIPVWFVPAKTGKFEIVCTQLCGLGHYRMRGFLTVHTPEEYVAWLAKMAPKKPEVAGA
ncbi:MAG: hypothetical protein HY586_01340 [Candidatus Omnitrophica bacterium]|nr:hypothetical protein [Candidatus Omnitrophota bacterium]